MVCLKAVLLFYKKLLRDLEKEGFEVNPYDPCVANKIVDGKQLTVTWHVDDLKVSHVKTEVIDDFIQWVRDKYEDFTKVKPSRGKKHDYLAMLLDYSTPGVVKIDMSDYIRKILKEFQYLKEVGTTGAKTPAAEYLFKTNEECDILRKELHQPTNGWIVKSDGGIYTWSSRPMISIEPDSTPISSTASRTAVWLNNSSSSWRPPGNEIWPG